MIDVFMRTRNESVEKRKQEKTEMGEKKIQKNRTR